MKTVKQLSELTTTQMETEETSKANCPCEPGCCDDENCSEECC
jgi:hypothetical protein